MFRLFKIIKDFLLVFPVTMLFKPVSKLFLFIAFFNRMISWIGKNKKQFLFNDFYVPIRNYDKRYKLYEFVSNQAALQTKPIVYLEFGVAAGTSFTWWLAHNQHADSKFYGFDTFEGLPENWGGIFAKGDMKADVPELTDQRAQFFKGLFQETLVPFISKFQNSLQSDCTRVIHMDADLYSSTAFTLSQLYPYFRKGDILLFDEFNVALHEFRALMEFQDNFYVKLKPLGAVNNFYQTAFMFE